MGNHTTSTSINSKTRSKLIAACTGGVVLAGLAGHARGTVVVDGTRDADYGGALAVQTNNTGFGDSTVGDGTSAGGAELDAAYGVVQGSNLNLFFAGNLANDFTHLNIFIADGRPGQNTINAQGTLGNMNGSKFSAGFNATYALDINGGGATFTEFVNQYDMTQASAPSNFFGSFLPNDGTGHTLHGVTFSFNNTNAAGVNGSAPSAADPTAAGAVATGLEISIPLSQLGTPHGSVQVLADINGNGGDNFLSNQFLPGLPTVVGNVGAGGTPYSGTGSAKFDFSATPGEYFTVTVPVTGSTNGVWALTGGGSWNASGSWTGGLPHVAADTATFGSAATSPTAAVTLDGSQTVGQVTFNNATTSYTISPGTGGTLTINDTGDTLGVNPSIVVQAGSHTISAPIVLAAGVSIDTLDNTSLTLSGPLGGSGDITKSGAGTLVLGGANTFSGNLTSTAGNLQLNTNASASTAAITLGDADVDNLPATITLGASGLTIANAITTNRDLANNNNLRTIAGTYTTGNSTLNGSLTLNGGVVLAAAAGGTITVAGVIQDGTQTTSAKHDLTAAGPGAVVLTAVNTYTGDTNANAGTLTIAAGAAIASTNVNVASGATLNINGSIGTSTVLNVSGTANIAGNPSGPAATRTIAALNVASGGAAKVNASAFPANPEILNATSTVTFADNTAKLDLTNNELLMPGPLSSAVSAIQSGSLITTATGGGLGSLDLGTGTVEVRFTLLGDTNLDGQVDVTDLGNLASSYGATSGALWVQGDTNYDNAVDVTDLGNLASNYGGHLAGGGPTDASGAIAASLATVASSTPAAVPEPTSLFLLLGLPMTMRRRRRGR